MTKNNDIPNRIVFDLEIATPIPEKNGRPNWDAAPKCGISVLCGWSTALEFPYTWILDSSRFPRVFLTENHAIGIFEEASGVVSWNGVGFDNKVIKEATPDLYTTYKNKKHVDLMAICALIKAGTDPKRLEKGVPEKWSRMAPTINASFLHRGWGLDAVAKKTLGSAGKMDGMGGAKAPIAWQKGRYSEVISYCCGDVALTKKLYLHALEFGYLESPTLGRVEIPRSVL